MPIPTRTLEPLIDPEASGNVHSERFASFRLAGAWVGTMLLVFGLGLVLTIFFQVYQFIREPKELKGYVDKWEVVVRGNVPVFGNAKEDTSAAEPEDPDSRQMHLQGTDGQSAPAVSKEMSIARPMMEMIALSARPLAIVVMLFLAGILVKIAVSIVDIGARLMHLTASEQGLLRRLIDEMRRK